MALGAFRWLRARRGPKLALVPAEPGSAVEGAAGALTWHSPSSLVIIAANLVPVWGVVVLDWPVFPLFLLFWLESVVILALHPLRILLARPAERGLWLRKPLLVLGSLFRHGVFTAAQGAIIVKLFAPADFARLDVDGHFLLEAIEAHRLWSAIAALALSHLLLLFRFILSGDYRLADMDHVFDIPLPRIVVLHVVLILSGVLVQGLGAPIAALLVLVLLKLALEVGLHLGAVEIRTPR